MTTEERLAKVERELAETKAQATRAKRRTRWLLAVVGLALVAWVMAGTVGPRTAEGQAEPKAVEQTRARLQETLDLDFERTSLDNVLKYIAEVKRLNIVIDPDLAAQGIDLAMRVVDLKVKGVSVESVLDTILGADLGYKVKAGYILVTTREKLQQNLPAVTHPVAAGAERVVRASAFILEDERGRVCASLDMTKDGPGLNLYDENGKGRVGLVVGKDGPVLSLYDAAGRPRVALDVNADVPMLTLRDAAGKVRAGLTVTEGGPGLALFDAASKVRAMLSVTKDGPGLNLLDAEDKVRAGLGVKADGPVLALRDENGKGCATLSVTKLGPEFGLYDAAGRLGADLSATVYLPRLGLYDSAGKVRVLLKAGVSEPEVGLNDENGKRIWSAP